MAGAGLDAGQGRELLGRHTPVPTDHPEWLAAWLQGQRRPGVRVDVDHDRVRAGRHGCPRQRRDQFPASPGVGRIDDHGEMRELLRRGDGGDVERIAVRGLVRPDTALAQDDFVIAAGEYVFGGQEEFFDGCGDASFQ